MVEMQPPLTMARRENKLYNYSTDPKYIMLAAPLDQCPFKFLYCATGKIEHDFRQSKAFVVGIFTKISIF